MNTTTRCRIWFTYRGQPRHYQPWCECGRWRAVGWFLAPAGAQAVADQHLENARHAQPVRELTR